MDWKNSRDWTAYVTFGELLSAVMEAQNISSGQTLAERAERIKPFHKLGHGRNINNWRNGQKISRSRKTVEQLEQVRKALQIGEPPENLGALWRLRLEEAFIDRKDRRRSKVSSTLADEQIIDADYVEIEAPAESAAEPMFAVSSVDHVPRRSNHRFRPELVTIVAVIGLASAAAWHGGPLRPSIREDFAGRLVLPADQLHLSADGFVLPDSSVRLLSEDDLRSLTGWDLFVARNEILARNGRDPSAPCLSRHFRQYAAERGGWYRARPDYDISQLNKIEMQNITLIDKFEQSVTHTHFTCQTH